MRWNKRIAMMSRMGAIRREVLLGLVVLAAFVVGFGAMLILLPRDQPVRVEPAADEVKAGEAPIPAPATRPRTAYGQASKAAEESRRTGSVTGWESSQAEEPVDLSNLPDNDNMTYTGFPRFKAAPTIVPRITTTRLSGVTPAVFHFSIQDTLMPGALLEHGEAVNPWRDCHVEWDFGDPNGPDRMTDPRFGRIVNPNTDQVGPDAVYVYRTPGTYTVTARLKARTGRDQYTEATTTTIRTNQVQRIFLPGGTTGTFRLGWGGNWTAPLTCQVPYYNNDSDKHKGTPSMFDVIAALETLPGLAGNVRGGATNATSKTEGWYWNIEFIEALGAQTNELIEIDSNNLVSPSLPRIDRMVKTGATPITSGTWTLSNGTGKNIPAFTTASMPYNVSNAALQAAIETALGVPGVCTVTSRYGASGSTPIDGQAEITQNSEWYIRWNSPYQYTASASGQNMYCNPTGFNSTAYLWYPSQHAQQPFDFDETAVEYRAGGTAAGITVTDGSLAIRYYDPVDGSDSNNGLTDAAPRKTWADMRTWLEGATAGEYRQALWKRGTTIPDNGSLTNGLKYARIGAYGTGARPILNVNTPTINNVVGGGSSRAVEHIYNDVVFSDLDYRCKPVALTTQATATGNPRFEFTNVYWDGCVFGNRVDYAIGSRTGFWKCTFNGDAFQENISKPYGEWLSFTGCTWIGGRYNPAGHPNNYFLEHPIYPGARDHALVRWAWHHRGSQPSALNVFWRGTVDEYPGPVHCWLVCDSLLEGCCSGTSAASGGGIEPWFRDDTYNRGILDCFLNSGVWVKCGGDTGVVAPRVSSGADIKTTDPPGTYGLGVVNPEAPEELYQRATRAFSSANCLVGVYRDCKVWAGVMEGRDWQNSTIPIGGPRSIGIVVSIAANPFGNSNDPEDCFVALQIYGCEFHNDAYGAVIEWRGGSYIYAADNTFSCPGSKSRVLNANLGDTPPLYFKRNSIYVENDAGRTAGNKAVLYGGVERTLAEAITAGLIDSTNVVRAPSWRDPDNGSFTTQRATSIGGVPVKLKDNRGWPRGGE